MHSEEQLAEIRNTIGDDPVGELLEKRKGMAVKFAAVGIIGRDPGRLHIEPGSTIGAGKVVPLAEKPKSLVDELVDEFSDLLLLQKRANINDEYLGKRIEAQKKLKEHAEELQKTRRGRRHIKAVTGRKLANNIKKAFRPKPKPKNDNG